MTNTIQIENLPTVIAAPTAGDQDIPAPVIAYRETPTDTGSVAETDPQTPDTDEGAYYTEVLSVPESLRNQDHWIMFNVYYDVDDKLKKMPISPIPNMPAQSNNPATWGPFNLTLKLAHKGKYAMAYCMSASDKVEDDLVFIDIDHCVENGVVSTPAQTIIDHFGGTYIEKSISGHGLHILVRGETGMNGNETVMIDGIPVDIEVYKRLRFMIVSGDKVDASGSEIMARQDSIQWLESMGAIKNEPVAKTSLSKCLDENMPLETLKQALAFIDAGPHGEWMRVLFALQRWGEKTRQEDAAWDLFDKWSQSTEDGNYNYDKNMDAWDNVFLREDEDKPVTVGSIIHKAKLNGFTFDGRSVTSVQNGKAGGRPPAPAHAHSARLFYEDIKCPESEQPMLRWTSQEWWAYTPDGWGKRLPDEIKGSIARFMQNQPDLINYCTSSYMNSLRDNLFSETLCGSPAPLGSWLTTTGTESGKNWIAFRDGVVINVWNLAERVAQGIAPDLSDPSLCRSKNPSFFSKSFVGYDFKNGTCTSRPLFDQYLQKVLPNPESRRMLQEMAGLLLSDETVYQKMFFLTGVGANGKSVFSKIITALVGNVNVSSVEPHMMADRHSSWPLTENKVNITADLSLYDELSSVTTIEGMLKAVSSGDLINVDKKYQHQYSANATARLLFCTNQMPMFKDKSTAIERRTIIINFPVILTAEEQDPLLDFKIIQDELPGVMQWAIEGLASVINHKGLFISEESQNLVTDHFSSCNKEAAFFNNNCCTSAEGFAAGKEMYDAYKTLCAENGYRSAATGSFYDAALRAFPGSTKGQRMVNGQRTRGINGIIFHGWDNADATAADVEKERRAWKDSHTQPFLRKTPQAPRAPQYSSQPA